MAETKDLPTKKAPKNKNDSLQFILAVSIPLAIVSCATAIFWYAEMTRDPAKDPTTPLKREGLFKIDEASITGLEYEFTAGRLTSRKLVKHYLDRMETLQRHLALEIVINPDIWSEAYKKDEERKATGSSIGGFYGIPVLLTENMATKDQMNTTPAFSISVPASVVDVFKSSARKDATLVEKLRRSGAIIFGKAAARERTHVQDDRRDRAFMKSSAATTAMAVSADIVPLALLCDSEAALLSAAGAALVVGLRSTFHPELLGDAIGVIAKSVEDAVLLLDTVAVSKPGSGNPCAQQIPSNGYAEFLRAGGANGKRVGVIRGKLLSLFNSSLEMMELENHIDTLRSLGATPVDPEEMEQLLERVFNDQKLKEVKSADDVVLLCELKSRFEKSLEELEVSPAGRTLKEVVEWLRKWEDERGMVQEGEGQVLDAANKASVEDEPYKMAKKLLAEYVVDISYIFEAHKLDVLMGPASSGLSQVAKIGGFPGVTIPGGFLTSHDIPSSKGMPYGITFIGLPCSEASLIQIGYAFEQATMLREALSFDTLQNNAGFHVPLSVAHDSRKDHGLTDTETQEL